MERLVDQRDPILVPLTLKDSKQVFCIYSSVEKLKKSKAGPGMVTYFCNPSYLGGRGRRITVWNWPRQKV
jgi:hypothetical protein